MIIAEVVIPQMFTAYAEDHGYLHNGLHQYQYFCEECDQAFAVAWGKIPGSMGYFERGNIFCCPYCGKEHSKNVAYIPKNEIAPNKVRLALKTYRNLVLFEVYCESVRFSDLFSVNGWRYKESFRFDIAKQTTTFSKYGHNGELMEASEIGSPLTIDVLKDSILRCFYADSLGNTNQKPALSRILKLLREEVQTKMEKYLGYKIPSMFVSSGVYHGMFLLPILNMAFRLRYPDAPNLPAAYRGEKREIKILLAENEIKEELFDGVAECTKQKTDYVTALIRANNLPNKAAVRRELSQDFFNVGLLVKAFSFGDNYDYALRTYYGIKKVWEDRVFVGVSRETLFDFLTGIAPAYGQRGLVRMVENYKELELNDCAQIYRQINQENRDAIKIERVELKELHDWMAMKHRLQTHQNYKFNVPDFIVNRLSMQTNRLKFFLPKESLELLKAGVKLHNCVATYGKAMKDNKKWIVLVADDNGKFTACLEVRGKELVQAKIDRNNAVKTDEKVNAAVVKWAKEAKIIIKTGDVKVSHECETVLLEGAG